jgi:hypothetical protein
MGGDFFSEEECPIEGITPFLTSPSRKACFLFLVIEENAFLSGNGHNNR